MARRSRRRSWGRRLLSWGAGLASGALLGAVGLVLWASHTAAGREAATELMLDRIRPRVNGSVTIDSLGPGGLLGGATAHGIRIEDIGGRPRLQVDSLQARYSIAALLGGTPELAELRLWGPVVDLQELAGVRPLTLPVGPREAAEGAEAGDSTGTPGATDIRIGDLVIENGLLLLEPAAGRERRVSGIEGELAGAVVDPASGWRVAARARQLGFAYPAMQGEIALTGVDGDLELNREGLVLDVERIRSPDAEGSGHAVLDWSDSAGVAVDVDLEMDRLALSGIAWLDERLDGLGEARGRVQYARTADPSGVPSSVVALAGVEADLEDGGRLAVDGTIVATGGETVLDGLRVRPDGLATAGIDRFLDEALPVVADLSGDVVLDGAVGPGLGSTRLAVQGDLDIHSADDGRAMARLSGGWTALGGAAASGLDVRAASLEYALLEALLPAAEWQGTGSLSVRADGELPTGMAVSVVAQHLHDGLASDLTVDGTVFGDTTIAVVDLDATLGPVWLESVASLFPGVLPDTSAAEIVSPALVTGALDGSLSLQGEPRDLAVDAALNTPAGALAATGTVNVLDPSAAYRLTASSDHLDLSRLIPQLPDSTHFRGTATAIGSGAGLDSLRGSYSVRAGQSRVGGLRLDTLALSALVDDEGVLHLEDLHAVLEGVALDGSGALGMQAGTVADGIDATVAAASIGPLRRLFMSGNLVAWDELPSIEQELMIALDGVDPDTFPRARDVRFGGSVDGAFRLTGSLQGLEADGTLVLDRFAYGTNEAGSLRAELEVDGLLDADAPTVEGVVTADSLVIADRVFQGLRAEGDFTPGAGGGLTARIVRMGDEEYRVQAQVALGDSGGRVHLDHLDFVLPDRRWNLRGPARLEWSPQEIAVSDFALVRQGGGGLSFTAGGTLQRHEPALDADPDPARDADPDSARDSSPDPGAAPTTAAPRASDLRVSVEALDLGVLGDILQMEEPPAGQLTAAASVAGPPDLPEWALSLRTGDARYGTLAFDSLNADGRLTDQMLDVAGAAWSGSVRSLAARGSIPLALDVLDRLSGLDAPAAPSYEAALADASGAPDPAGRALRFFAEADSLPAALALNAIRSLEEVGGFVSGSVTVGGTRSAPEPDGLVRWEGGSALVAPFGARLSSVDVALDIAPDAVVTVTGAGTSSADGSPAGSIGVAGSVAFADFADSIPLDLAFTADNFQVVNRPDMVASVSTDAIALTGSWEFPFIEGVVGVEEGTVFLEEFEHTANVVDLYDPALSAAAIALMGAGAESDDFAADRIPFLQNLRILVDLRVGTGSFLRSRQMNVETTGDLSLTFDRRTNQLVLQGQMEVERGTYALGPRTLRLTEGVFEFVGTPGFDPGVSLTAESRLRTREGQPLVITADISGTLLTPFLSLSSDAEAAMSEADLINYLVLGRPTSALVADGGAASVGAGTSLILGQFANEIGYVLAQELGVDHLSVSQAEQGQANAAFGASSLQVEVGRYVLDDVFLTAVYQRGFCADPTLPVNSGGVRLEVGMPRDVRLESFLEGRCTRGRYRGLGDASLELEHIWGFSLFREWGR